MRPQLVSSIVVLCLLCVESSWGANSFSTDNSPVVQDTKNEQDKEKTNSEQGQEKILLQKQRAFNANAMTETSARQTKSKTLKESRTLPKTEAGKALKKWVKAHNNSSRKEFNAWIKKFFAAEFQGKIDLEKHLDWYVETTKMFGKLESKP